LDLRLRILDLRLRIWDLDLTMGSFVSVGFGGAAGGGKDGQQFPRLFQ
jgi:hypothetical protein